MKVIEGEDGMYGLVVNQDELDFIAASAGQTNNEFVPTSGAMYEELISYVKSEYELVEEDALQWRRKSEL